MPSLQRLHAPAHRRTRCRWLQWSRGDGPLMKAVILAGGLGMRLRPFTEVLPKPLLPIGDRSILEHQIGSLHTAGVTDVYVATNYKSDVIEAYLGDGSKYGLKIHISRESVPLGTAGPVRLLESQLQVP